MYSFIVFAIAIAFVHVCLAKFSFYLNLANCSHCNSLAAVAQHGPILDD